MIILILCAIASATTIVSDFNIQGDGTMMHYSYLEEPELQESGYTHGYKAGSMNYFNNGEINFSDNIDYDDGKYPSDGNSSVFYRHHVDFNGTKGISEFYGKGFFPSNRAISAWKKIRYDDLNYNKSSGTVYLSGSARIAGSRKSSTVSGSYDLGESRYSSRIITEASLFMGPKKTGEKNDYDFQYNATVEDGVIEISDSTGWTNRTGARRIDWEQNAQMRGNFTIQNNLYGENLFFPAANPDKDWLSCCIGGGAQFENEIDEEIESSGEDPGWPNVGTYATLMPEITFPSKIRSQNSTIDPYTGKFRSSPPTYRDFECNYNNCSSFECIYMFGLPSKTTQNETKKNGEQEIIGKTAIDVDKWILSETNDSVKFNIVVGNAGPTRLDTVTVTDVMPEGLDYIEGNSSVISDREIIGIMGKNGGPYENLQITEDAKENAAKPIEPTSKLSRNGTDSTKSPWNLTYNIGPIETGDVKYLYINVIKLSPDVDVKENSVYAEGTWSAGNETDSDTDKASYSRAFS